MTMDRMVEYLENRGFKATKKYIPEERVYVFKIYSGDQHITGRFKYPDTKDEGEKDAIQRKFLDDLIDAFHELTANRFYIQPARHNGKSTLQLELYQKLMEDQEYVRYVEADAMTTMKLYNRMSLAIKDVIFSPPATIVFWADGTKTVVKCQDEDKYDPEKGLAMAIAKKAMGNKYSYYNTFKHWLKKWPRDYVKQMMKNNSDFTWRNPELYLSQWASRMAELLNIRKENSNET